MMALLTHADKAAATQAWWEFRNYQALRWPSNPWAGTGREGMTGGVSGEVLLDSWRKFFSQRVLEHWIFPRELAWPQGCQSLDVVGLPGVCAWSEVGFDDSCGSRPTQDILYLYDSRIKHCPAKRWAKWTSSPWKHSKNHPSDALDLGNLDRVLKASSCRPWAAVTEETKYLGYGKEQLGQFNLSAFITVGEAPASPVGTGWGVWRAGTLW